MKRESKLKTCLALSNKHSLGVTIVITMCPEGPAPTHPNNLGSSCLLPCCGGNPSARPRSTAEGKDPLTQTQDFTCRGKRY